MRKAGAPASKPRSCVSVRTAAYALVGAMLLSLNIVLMLNLFGLRQAARSFRATQQQRRFELANDMELRDEHGHLPYLPGPAVAPVVATAQSAAAAASSTAAAAADAVTMPPRAVAVAPPAAAVAPPAAAAPAAAGGVRLTKAGKPYEFPPPGTPPPPRSAIVILVSGDEAGRMSVALIQSLRDVGTHPDIEVLVILSRNGKGSRFCDHVAGEERRQYRWRGLVGPKVQCDSNEAIEPDIVSYEYLEAYERLGAKYAAFDAIPDTPYTRHISGGRQLFWGMSLNKLVIFNMTQFDKILFLDSDVLILKNIDHLLHRPALTAAFTYSCCNRNVAPHISGGMWVIEPSRALGERIWNMLVEGMPVKDEVTGAVTYETWKHADMSIINALFAEPGPDISKYMWPKLQDVRHGYAEGVRQIPYYTNMSEADWLGWATDPISRQPMQEGFIPELWDGVTPVWHALSVLYDQCVGNCECLVGRDTPQTSFSVHFSCMGHIIVKPGVPASDEEFLRSVYTTQLGCVRHYYLLWYELYKKAMGGPLPPPLYTGAPVPSYNETHDALVHVWRGTEPRMWG